MSDNKYSRGKIYKITGGGKCYVGSTIETLNQRLSRHKYRKNCISRELLDCEDLAIELIEEYPCNDRNELLWRERYWIENTECINKYRPIRTEEEIESYMKDYYEANIDKIKEQKKEYYQANKEKAKEYQREYYQKTKKSLTE